MQEPISQKRLYRSNTDKMFVGIFGGLGEYWKTDPVILRLVWVLVTVFTGFVPGIIAYIFAAFVIPVKQSGEGVHQPTKNE